VTAPLVHIVGCLLATVLGTQEPTTPTAPPTPDDTEPVKDAVPSLDELLGLDGAKDNAADQAARQNQEELERRLSDVELGDVFDIALEKMAVSADLLGGKHDSGLGTQRVQKDILARLDQLIDIAKQMSQQQQMSSSAGGSGQSKPKPGAEQQQQQQAGGQRSQSGSQGGQAVDPPPGQEGDINTIIQETGSEWGHLPARLRDMLEQAQKSHSSPRYRRLTEQYYKRLAEEGSS
jgi:hypothetical protein